MALMTRYEAGTEDNIKEVVNPEEVLLALLMVTITMSHRAKKVTTMVGQETIASIP